MTDAVEHGGDYVTPDLRFHQGLLRASHNRMMMQMSQALGAVLRVSFELSTLKPERAGRSLPQHRAVLDAVIARDPKKAERAILVLIDDAGREIERMLSSRRKLPSLSVPARRLTARAI
jgi:DNA-binding FadR family transcriptional regulator